MSTVFLPSTPDTDIGEWLTSDASAFEHKANALWQNALAAGDDHPYRLKYGLSADSVWVHGLPGFVNGESVQNAVVVLYSSGSPRKITAIRFIVMDEDGSERISGNGSIPRTSVPTHASVRPTRIRSCLRRVIRMACRYSRIAAIASPSPRTPPTWESSAPRLPARIRIRASLYAQPRKRARLQKQLRA